GQGRQSTNIVNGNHLHRLVRSERLSQSQDTINLLWPGKALKILHKKDRAENSDWQADSLDILFNGELALKVRNAGLSFRTAHRGIDKMLDTGGLGGIGQGLALPDFSL